MFLTSGGGAAAEGAFKLWLLCSFITTKCNDREEKRKKAKKRDVSAFFAACGVCGVV